MKRTLATEALRRRCVTEAENAEEKKRIEDLPVDELFEEFDAVFGGDKSCNIKLAKGTT